MFFARIWSLILICYINQGILVIKFGCQIPRNDLQKDKIGLSPAPIARFYISITAKFISHLGGAGSHFFSSSLQRCHLSCRYQIPHWYHHQGVARPSVQFFQRQRQHQRQRYHNQSVTRPSVQLLLAHWVFTTHSREMFYAPTNQFRLPSLPHPWEKNKRRLSYFSFSNPVLTSFPQTGRKIEVNAFFFCSGDGSSGKDQPFIVAQHEAGPRWELSNFTGSSAVDLVMLTMYESRCQHHDIQCGRSRNISFSFR